VIGDSERRTPVILVVDDDDGYRQLIRWALEDEGFAVETAANWTEALRNATRHPPVLAIVDVALPGANGIALARELRSASEQPIPIITITADGSAAYKARQMQAVAWLAKPFNIDDLVATVTRVLMARDN
jgi:DNA-binding response OmpR family regulator